MNAYSVFDMLKNGKTITYVGRMNNAKYTVKYDGKHLFFYDSSEKLVQKTECPNETSLSNFVLSIEDDVC